MYGINFSGGVWKPHMSSTLCAISLLVCTWGYSRANAIPTIPKGLYSITIQHHTQKGTTYSKFIDWCLGDRNFKIRSHSQWLSILSCIQLKLAICWNVCHPFYVRQMREKTFPMEYNIMWMQQINPGHKMAVTNSFYPKCGDYFRGIQSIVSVLVVSISQEMLTEIQFLYRSNEHVVVQRWYGTLQSIEHSALGWRTFPDLLLHCSRFVSFPHVQC